MPSFCGRGDGVEVCGVWELELIQDQERASLVFDRLKHHFESGSVVGLATPNSLEVVQVVYKMPLKIILEPGLLPPRTTHKI